MLADPTLAIALMGYPLDVTSAPCYNCGTNIELPEIETFTVERPLTINAQWELRARVADHNTECQEATDADIAAGALNLDDASLSAEQTVMIKSYGNYGTVLDGPDDFGAYRVSHDEGWSSIPRNDLATV
jgi:hypothetical protein